MLAIGGPTPANVRQFRVYIERAKIGAILVEAGEAGPWPAILGHAGLRGQATGGVLVYRT
jgi:hypothetical protein